MVHWFLGILPFVILETKCVPPGQRLIKARKEMLHVGWWPTDESEPLYGETGMPNEVG